METQHDIFEDYPHVGEVIKVMEEAKRATAGKTLADIMGPKLYEAFQKLGDSQ